jgi:hypothetical protein
MTARLLPHINHRASPSIKERRFATADPNKTAISNRRSLICLSLLAELVEIFHERHHGAVLKRESEAFDNLRPGEDMVGLEKAFEAAEEDYRPGEGKKK